MRMREELSTAELLYLAPSIAAEKPYSSVSERYSFIPTIKVVEILRDDGWYPVEAEEIRTRKEDKLGYQKHMIKLQKRGLFLSDDEVVEAVLLNAHDGTCRYQFYIGVFRFVCCNGMITGDTFERFSIRHLNVDPKEIIRISHQIGSEAPRLADTVNRTKSINMTEQEEGVFALAAHQLVYDDIVSSPIKPTQLLTERRGRDRQEKNLWVTFNKIQENLIKGGLLGVNANGQRRRTRKVKSIDKNVKLNRALWTLMEKMAELKS